MSKKRKIRIPDEIVQAIKQHLAELPAESVEEYIEVVLREYLLKKGYLSAYSKTEEKEVEKRLRDLGYLD